MEFYGVVWFLIVLKGKEKSIGLLRNLEFKWYFFRYLVLGYIIMFRSLELCIDNIRG